MDQLNNNLEELSNDSILELLRVNLEKRMNIDVQQFLKQYDSGTLEDPGEVADLLILADLLRKPENEPITS